MRRIAVRGSNLGIRAFAVAVLVLGLVAGLYAGNQKSNADTLTAVEPAAGAVTEPPAAAELRVERDAKVYAADVRASASAHAFAVTQAKTKAKAAAQAAGEAAAQAKADATRVEEGRKAASERASRSASRSQPSVASGGGGAPAVPVDCESYSGNREIGCSLLSWAGFGTAQMRCLAPLWDHESSWNELARNPSSGAYGIPQALPASKMGKYGSDWKTNPVPQIKWGLQYIKERYGNPCGAWSAFQSKGWY